MLISAPNLVAPQEIGLLRAAPIPAPHTSVHVDVVLHPSLRPVRPYRPCRRSLSSPSTELSALHAHLWRLRRTLHRADRQHDDLPGQRLEGDEQDRRRHTHDLEICLRPP